MISQKYNQIAIAMAPLSPIPPSSHPHSSEAPTPSTKDNDTSNDAELAQTKESISLSPAGQEIYHYTNEMNELPDIREERITEIQRALEQSSYSVSAKDLADKMIQEISTRQPNTD